MALEHIKSWSQKAKCKDIGPRADEMFFPDTRNPNSLRDLKLGKQFCTDCPVISQCKIYAIAHGVFGVWGGTSKKDRDKISPLAIQAIKTMYLEARQLEPLNYHNAPPKLSKQLPELLAELDDPIDLFVTELGPTLNLSSEEDLAYIRQSM